MQLKYSQNPSINILFDKVVCTFGLVPDLYIVPPNTETCLQYAETYTSGSVLVCVCVDSGYRCSIIQSISLGFKALTEN